MPAEWTVGKLDSVIGLLFIDIERIQPDIMFDEISVDEHPRIYIRQALGRPLANGFRRSVINDGFTRRSEHGDLQVEFDIHSAGRQRKVPKQN